MTWNIHSPVQMKGICAGDEVNKKSIQEWLEQHHFPENTRSLKCVSIPSRLKQWRRHKEKSPKGSPWSPTLSREICTAVIANITSKHVVIKGNLHSSYCHHHNQNEPYKFVDDVTSRKSSSVPKVLWACSKHHEGTLSCFLQ